MPREGRSLAAVADVADREVLVVGELGPIVRDLVRRVGAETALLVVGDQVVVSVGGLVAADAPGPSSLPFLAPADGFLGRVLSSGHADVEPLDPGRDLSLGTAASGASFTWAAGAPVSPPRGPAGALCAGFTERPVPDPATVLWVVESYARLAALCLQEPRALDGLLASARVDELTGCSDYTATHEVLDREIGRSERHRRPLSCALIDLDGFKRVNDSHGHPHGNEMLAEVAAVLRAGVRIDDTVGRYGGDEFVAILPDTDLTAARALAERLRSRISARTLRDGRVHLNASVGIAQWQPGTTVDELLEDAGQALLDAKRAGGGIVCSVHGPAPWTAGASSARDADPGRSTAPLEVRFCTHCGDRSPPEHTARMCGECGLGIVISAPGDAAPAGTDAFLVLDQHMLIAAISTRAQALLAVTETQVVDRHVDELLAPARGVGTHRHVLAAARHDDTSPRHLDLHARTTTGQTVPFRARIGPCGPPHATLIVLSDANRP
jgi:diguanylate cyclase (GGDEF)-like protein